MKIKVLGLFAFLGACFLMAHSSTVNAAANTTCSLLDSQLLIVFRDNTVMRYNANTLSTIDASYFSLPGGTGEPHESVMIDETTLWQTDGTNIVPVNLSTGVTGSPIPVGGAAQGLTLGPDGYVYAFVAGPSIARIQTTSPYTVTTVIPGGTGGFVNEPFNAGTLGIEFGPDGNLYIISVRDDAGTIRSTIKRYNGTTYAYIDDYIAETAGDWQDFSFHTDGYIYVTEYNTGVFRFNANTRAYVDQYSSLPSAYSIAFSPTGQLLMTQLSGDVNLFTAPNTSTAVFSPGATPTKLARYLAPACYDWGDAANSGSIGTNTYSHPVTLAQNGARHLIQHTTFAGLVIDSEADGQPSANANGDDSTDDEDSLVLSASSVTAGTLVNATFTANGRGIGSPVNCQKFLNVWVDLNGNGDWSDSGEQVVAGGALGNNCTYNFSFTPTANNGPIMIRTRYSSLRTLSATGGAPDGEVEDFVLGITTSTPAPSTPSPTTLSSPTVPNTGKGLMKNPLPYIAAVIFGITGTAIVVKKIQ